MRAVIRALSRPYACRWGAPVVDRVDSAIFHETYFMNCMGCGYCFDSCCQYGVDVDAPTVERMDAVAAELAAFTGVPRERWFTGEWTEDPEQPGGRQTRTKRGRRRVRLPQPQGPGLHHPLVRALERGATTTSSSPW